ncbi:MAG: ferritin family protein [bacterium]
MKQLLFFLIIAGLMPCNKLFSQQKTIANLTEAYRFESANSVLFDAYANQAQKEGYPQIATFFKAVAKVANIHAANFQTVLGKMGSTVTPGTTSVVPMSTQIDLDEAMKSVRIEAGIKYAEYMDQAQKDGATSAVKALRWAKETHQQSLDKYINASSALQNGKTSSLPAFYWVCPKCGNLYDVPKPEETCGFCSTERKKFIKVQ